MFLCFALLWWFLFFFSPCVALNIALVRGVECKSTMIVLPQYLVAHCALSLHKKKVFLSHTPMLCIIVSPSFGVALLHKCTMVFFLCLFVMHHHLAIPSSLNLVLLHKCVIVFFLWFVVAYCLHLLLSLGIPTCHVLLLDRWNTVTSCSYVVHHYSLGSSFWFGLL